MASRIFTWVVIGWITTLCNVEALSLIPLTDATRIEQADRIVIGTVEIKDGVAQIHVEEVLKGNANPTTITTDRIPHSRQIRDGAERNKVLWIEKGEESPYQPLAELAYIEEGSERWMLYHSLIDPAPLLENPLFEKSNEAAQVLGYLFEPVTITSSDAPMVADRLASDVNFKAAIPWNFEGEMELKCRMVEERPGSILVDSMSAEGPAEMLIRPIVEKSYLENFDEPLPPHFSLKIAVQKHRSVGSVSYEKAAEYLRRRLGMLMSSPTGQDSSAAEERRMADHLTRTAMKSLMKMKDLDSVPRLIEIALQVNSNHSRLPFNFLSNSRDPRAFQPMCNLLAKHAAEYPENHWLSDGAARVLGAIGDPAALPYLEDAVRNGVELAYYPLGHLGNVETMGLLIESANDGRFEALAHARLYWLAKRSNRETEPWMELKQVTRGDRDEELRRQWGKWWEANKDGTKLVRSYEEAARGWMPTWKVEEPRAQTQTETVDHPRKHGWTYAVGLALLLLVAHRLRSRVVRSRQKGKEADEVSPPAE